MKWLLPVLAMVLASCDEGTLQTRIAGGSAVEGETVTARLVDVEGNRLVATRVTVESPDSVGWNVVEISDSAGRVSISVPPGLRTLVLTVEDPSAPGRKLVFHLDLRPELDTTLVAPRWGGLFGRILSPSGWTPDSVRIAGLKLDTVADGGSFLLAHVPSGEWPVEMVADSAGVVRRFDLGTVVMPTGGDGVSRVFAPRTNSNARMDFDDTLAIVPNVGCLPDLASSRTNPASDGRCFDFAGGKSAWSGSSLRWNHANPGLDTCRLFLASALGRVSSSLRRHDTLSFYARGTGTIHLRLGGTDLDTAHRIDIALAPSWKRVVVVVEPWLVSAPSAPTLRWIDAFSAEQAWLVVDDLQILSGGD